MSADSTMCRSARSRLRSSPGDGEGGAEGLGAVPPSPSPGDDLNLDRAERHMVESALKKHSYNISLAAAELGLTRASLYRRMDKHGL